MRRASELEPSSERYAYVYAVALRSSGRRDDALKVLKETLAKHPDDRDILAALISFSRESGDVANALAYATQLEQVSPDLELARLIEALRREVASPNARPSPRR